MPQFLIVGLGNPGEDYAHTRHNAGFDAVDMIAAELGVRYWKNEGGALTAKAAYKDVDLVLAKPQSYMNTSGGPVKKLCQAYGFTPDQVVVLHDDLDLPTDKIRVKMGGGAAGHNGLKSIIDKLGTKEWYRVRLGIGRPPGRMPVVDFVLQQPRKDAFEEFQATCDRGAQATLFLVTHDLQKTQQEFN